MEWALQLGGEATAPT